MFLKVEKVSKRKIKEVEASAFFYVASGLRGSYSFGLKGWFALVPSDKGLDCKGGNDAIY